MQTNCNLLSSDAYSLEALLVNLASPANKNHATFTIRDTRRHPLGVNDKAIGSSFTFLCAVRFGVTQPILRGKVFRKYLLPLTSTTSDLACHFNQAGLYTSPTREVPLRYSAAHPKIKADLYGAGLVTTPHFGTIFTSPEYILLRLSHAHKNSPSYAPWPEPKNRQGRAPIVTGVRLPRPENSTLALLTTVMAERKQVKPEVLGKTIKDVLIACGERLKSASYESNGDFEFIDDRKTLEEACCDFIKVQPPLKVSICARYGCCF